MQSEDQKTLQKEIAKLNPFESLDEELFLNIERTRDYLAGPVQKLLKEHGLTESTYNVLRILRGAWRLNEQVGAYRQCLPCLEVARRMIFKVPDITRLINRLEEQSWVERLEHPEDRRVVLVRITSKGRKVVDSLDKPLQAVHQENLARLKSQDKQRLIRLLEKIRY